MLSSNFTCDLKNACILFEPNHVKLIFLWTSPKKSVKLFDILDTFNNLANFIWRYLTYYINHLSPSQGYLLWTSSMIKLFDFLTFDMLHYKWKCWSFPLNIFWHFDIWLKLFLVFRLNRVPPVNDNFVKVEIFFVVEECTSWELVLIYCNSSIVRLFYSINNRWDQGSGMPLLSGWIWHYS